jgi:hypothetical protein
MPRNKQRNINENVLRYDSSLYETEKPDIWF